MNKDSRAMKSQVALAKVFKIQDYTEITGIIFRNALT